MYTNNTLNLSSFRKSHRIPILLVHLKMQVIFGIHMMSINVKNISTKGNTIFLVTSTTFIFDRGKISHITLPSSFICKGGRKFTISIAVSWSTTETTKFNKYLITFKEKHAMSNSKMPSMFTYADVTAKTKPNLGMNSSGKRLGNNQLNDVSSQYENKRQINRHASKLLQHAQLLQTSYENSLEKMMSVNPIENMINIISRAEKIINSNCVLLTGLPLINEDFPAKTFKTWVQLMIPHLESQLRITVKQEELSIYLTEFPDGTIQHDGDSCAFPIPIQLAQFKLGGIPSPIPEALGVTAGGLKNIFCMFQAIPSQTDPISSIRSSVELCTLRGLPGNPYEVQAILAMVYYKIETYFAPLSSMDIKDFDVVVHRRAHKRQHSSRPQSFEFVITVYCRPKGKSPGAIREMINIPSGPADICLDWKGEVWANYFIMSQQAPSMVLLHKTPTLCIFGLHREADSQTIITAFMEDNSTLPLVTLLYCWIGPRDEATSPRALHLVFSDTPPAVTIGVNLVALGAQRQDGDQNDNPSMEFTRNLIAGIIIHHQFMAGTSKGTWTPQMRTAWATKVAKIVKDMPTLKKGHKLGLTHAGLSTWEPPVFTSTSPASCSQPIDPSQSSSKPGVHSDFRRSNRGYNINDLPTDDEDNDDDLSFHSSSMSEEHSPRVRPQRDMPMDADYFRNLLAAQEERFQNRLDQLFDLVRPHTNPEPPPVMEGGSQSGGSNSTSLYNT